MFTETTYYSIPNVVNENIEFNRSGDAALQRLSSTQKFSELEIESRMLAECRGQTLFCRP